MLAEQKQGAIQPSTLHVVSAARALGGPVTLLVAGHQVAAAAEAAARVEGVQAVLKADDASLEHTRAEPTAALLVAVQNKWVAGTAVAHPRLRGCRPGRGAAPLAALTGRHARACRRRSALLQA